MTNARWSTSKVQRGIGRNFRAFATAIAVLQARRIGENPDVIVDLALASLLMRVVGGRIFHVLFDGYFWDYVHLCTDPSLVQESVPMLNSVLISGDIGGGGGAVTCVRMSSAPWFQPSSVSSMLKAH